MSTLTEPTITRLSPAAIERFRSCPRRYWYQDITRTPTPQERSPVLAQANAVHHALKQFFGLRSPEERSVENLHRALRAVWSQHRAGAFASRDEEAAYGREALELLSTFAAHNDLFVCPLIREQRIRFRLANGLTLVGRIDRIDRAATGGIEIVDYKTGRRELEVDDVAGEAATMVYLAAVERLFSEPVTAVRFIYLRNGSETAWTPEEDDRLALRERLETLCDEITSANEFPAMPAAHCDWCPFNLICEDRQRVTLADLDVPEGMPF